MRISDWSSDVCSSDLRKARQMGIKAHAATRSFLCILNRAVCGRRPGKCGIKGQSLFARSEIALASVIFFDILEGAKTLRRRIAAGFVLRRDGPAPGGCPPRRDGPASPPAPGRVGTGEG